MKHHTKKKKQTIAKFSTKRDKEMSYVVQISDSKVLRKDILESLREVIIFMQGYEKFRKIQEEKVATIAVLKEQIKEVESLINHHLRKSLPVGKLKPIFKDAPKQMSIVTGLEQPEEVPAPVLAPASRQEKPVTTQVSRSSDELEELESQLQDIEQQLQNI